LLAASDSDSGNTYITLSAKALNPEIFVIARAGKLESEARALRAGADRVISPYVIGGRRMALSAIDPSIVEVMDTLAGGVAANRIVAEIEVTEESGLAGASLREISDAPGLVLLGLQRAGGELVVGVPDELRVAIGDRLMVAGPEREVARVTRQDRRNDRP
jgi:voltage-gated potassium channel